MEFRPYYMAREWAKNGHQVTILAASYSHLRWENPSVEGAVTVERIDGIDYVWLRTPAYSGNGWRRGLNILSFVWRLLRFCASSRMPKRCDVIIASSTHTLDIFPAWLMARRAGARLVFEVHDLWPLSPIELSGMSPMHPFIMALQMCEDFTCRKAQRVISILPKTKAYLASRGMAAEKWRHVPNGICVAEWEHDRLHASLPSEHAELLAELKRDGYFIVGYAGAHGLANLIGNFIRAAQLLRDRKVAFVLVGQGPEKDSLQSRARALGLGNCRFLPPVKKSSIPALLERFDALYLGLAPCGLFRYGISPNKLVDYLMAGRPIIMAIAAGNDMVSESGAGITIPPDDPQALVKAIDRLADMSPADRAEMGRRGHDYAVRHHDYAKLSADFLAWIGDRTRAAV